MTPQEFAVLVQRYFDGLQLQSTLSVLSQMSKRSSDAEANHIGQVAMACATAAQSDSAKLRVLLQGVASYVATVAEDASQMVRSGVATAAFGGGAAERHDITGIAATWVTASTVVYVVPGAVPPAAGAMFDFEKFQCWHVAANNVPGVSFDIRTYNSGSPPAASYSFLWHSFG